ncbi:MAG: Ig-like domain repeat protein, partial [Gemmataceae bacterium]
MNLLRLFSPWKWARECMKPRVRQKVIRQERQFRPCLEVLEDRTLLTAYMVTLATDGNANGGGQQDNANANSGDLRWCLTQADNAAGNTITFANQVSGKIIDLQAALPDISQNMTIAPAAGVGVTVERPNGANTNFRIFTVDKGDNVTLGAFTIQGGSAGIGGGILNYGILTLQGTTVKKNTTTSDNDYPAAGGGIANYNGSLILNGASIILNQAVSGPGQPASIGGGIYNLGTVSTAAGAPLLSLTGNQATYGAAIANDNNSSASLNNVQFTNNIAQDSGGGIWNNSEASLNIQNSTFTGNQAVGSWGGGIYTAGIAAINQNTFTNNSAGLQGGAIKNSGAASGNGNTVNGNKVNGIPGALAANETGGGISNDPGATFSLVNSIVAGNTAPTNPDVDGNFNDLGHNFIGDGTGGDFINGVNGDLVGDSYNPLNPMLGPLQNNGGCIDTELPQAGSLVIDAGDNSYAMATDARGYVRIINNIIDLGAVETNSYPANTATASVFLSSSVNPSTPNQLVTFTAMVSGMNGTPTGSVTFLDGDTMLGTAVLDGNGDATLSTSGLSLGSQTIVAVYSGDDTYASNTATLTQMVQQSISFTLLNSNTMQSQPGQPITFTASVMSSGGSTPTGTVTFLDGTTTL